MPIESRPALLAAEPKQILDQRAGDAPPAQAGATKRSSR
jgi:hypothetical protein